MIRFFGIDIHKDVAYVCAVDGQGRIVLSLAVPMNHAFDQFAAQLTKADHVAVEASTNAFAIHDVLARYAGEVVVVNPIKTRLIAEARIKSDKLDAQNLAQLLRSGFIYQVWVPPTEIRELRSLVGQRTGLNKQRTQVKNALQALLRTHRIEYETGKVFTQAGRRWLRSLELPGLATFQRDQHLTLLESIEVNLAAYDKEIARLAGDNPVAKRLMQQTGINYYSALAIYAEIGDIERFSSPKKLCSYAGLVPTLDQSGKKCRVGRITKAGRKRLRWILVECAQVACNHDPSLKKCFDRIAQKKGRNVAVVAVARRLLVRIWHLWHEDENHRHMKKDLWTRKLQDLAYDIGCRELGKQSTDFIQDTAQELEVKLTEEQARGRARNRKKKEAVAEQTAPAPTTTGADPGSELADPDQPRQDKDKVLKVQAGWVDLETGELLKRRPSGT